MISYLGHNVNVNIIDADGHIEKHWLSGNFYETKRNGLLSYLYATGVTGKIIDIGANIGNHTLFFAKCLEAEVHAIEPNHEAMAQLQENVKLNDLKVNYYSLAVGAEQCWKALSDEQTLNKKIVEGTGVPVLPLDNVDIPLDYDYIKIDVEGYEQEVLKGAKETLTNGKGLVSIEVE
jgi:FkbM family methyltransferase